jgi:IMP and pyridine-specific 5'-nucleotidase
LQLHLSHSSIQLLSFDQQGLLAVPFVLHSQPTVIFEPQKESTEQMALTAQKRYLDIMRDVEELINDHCKLQGVNNTRALLI